MKPTLAHPRRAFTLVELMLSVGMVFILVLGINYVFRSAANAVGAGQTTLGLIRDSAAAQPLLFEPFRDAVKNPPFFCFTSQVVPQYLNAEDAQTSSQGLSGNPLIVQTDNSNVVTSADPYDPNNPAINPAYDPANVSVLGPRVHRTDVIRFFAHGLFPRRTGNDGQFVSQTTASDACITIGQALLPTVNQNSDAGGNTLYFPPITDYVKSPGNSGSPNPDSYQLSPAGVPGTFASTITAQNRIGAYASDWVLAKNIILLKDPSTNLIAPEHGYPRNPPGAGGIVLNWNGTDMMPLGRLSPDDQGKPPNGTYIESSRYDLALVTMEQFQRYISDEIVQWRTSTPLPLALQAFPNASNYTGFTGASTATAAHLWWIPIIFNYPANNAVTVYLYQLLSAPPNASQPAISVPYVVSTPGANRYFGPYDQYNDFAPIRFQANPQFSSPLTATSISQLSPYFLQHCSQFIVEYAGDYLNQDPATGDMKGLGPDGQIDFYLDQAGNKHTRWYGLPRSTTGTVHLPAPGAAAGSEVLIRGYNSSVTTPEDPTTGGLLNYFADVIPLRDYYTMWFHHLNGPTDNYIYTPPWEVEVNFPFPSVNAVYPATSPLSGQPAPDYARSPDFTAGVRYICAWANDTPSMVRILMKVDDPNNQVKDGPWYEYVFRLK